MEIEVPNPGFRLKPGMYARVDLTIGSRENAMTVPPNAVVELNGKTGVFVGQASKDTPQPASNPRGGPGQGAPMTAKFIPVETGIRDGEHVEITSGIEESARVITTGATALKDGDRIVPANQSRQGAPANGARSGGPGGAQ
jgi:HlyD family secretion protein